MLVSAYGAYMRLLHAPRQPTRRATTITTALPLQHILSRVHASAVCLILQINAVWPPKNMIFAHVTLRTPLCAHNDLFFVASPSFGRLAMCVLRCIASACQLSAADGPYPVERTCRAPKHAAVLLPQSDAQPTQSHIFHRSSADLCKVSIHAIRRLRERQAKKTGRHRYGATGQEHAAVMQGCDGLELCEPATSTGTN
jgi:hypothetical protein